MQYDIFSAASLARTIQVPPAEKLEVWRYQEWPFPGFTPTECAQAAMAQSTKYADMLAAIIKSQGGNELSSEGIQALIPNDWRKVMGTYLHATLVEWQCKMRDIEMSYLMKPCGTHVSMYRPHETQHAAAQKGE